MSQECRLVGIAGPAGCGKDSVAFIIKDLVACIVDKYSFADPLRDGLKGILGIDMSQTYWKQNKEVAIDWLGKSPRELMQTLGTEWGRELVHPNLWVLLADQRFKRSVSMDVPFLMVMPDLRFHNELEWMRENGAAVIHVTRPGIKPVKSHISEAGLPVGPKDYVIDNDGDLDDLRDRVIAVLQDLNMF